MIYWKSNLDSNLNEILKKKDPENNLEECCKRKVKDNKCPL